MTRNLIAAISVFCLYSVALAQHSRSAESCLDKNNDSEAKVCIESKVRESEEHLSRNEAELLGAIQASTHAAGSREPIAKAVGASAGEFRSYRSKQCELQALIAANGSSGTHRRQVCLIAMNEQRIADLQGLKAVVR